MGNEQKIEQPEITEELRELHLEAPLTVDRDLEGSLDFIGGLWVKSTHGNEHLARRVNNTLAEAYGEEVADDYLIELAPWFIYWATKKATMV